MRFLTVAQIDVLAAAVPDRYTAWVLVAAWGGLRWSELAGLRPTDIDGPRITIASQLLRRTDGTWSASPPRPGPVGAPSPSPPDRPKPWTAT